MNKHDLSFLFRVRFLSGRHGECRLGQVPVYWGDFAMTDANAFCTPSSGITFVTGEWVNQIQRDLVCILTEAGVATVSAAPCCGTDLLESKPASGSE
ncbi:hypothetical protein J3Y26_003785 [Salmonella enterica]|nr:hypothetical protein [Salmonella enterica]